MKSSRVCKGESSAEVLDPATPDLSMSVERIADCRYFADNIRDDYANGALDGQVEAALEEMRELSIYGP